MFVLTLADGLCVLSGVSTRCAEIGTSSVDWAQLSGFYLNTGREFSF
jgi:hypothetical protein